MDQLLLFLKLLVLRAEYLISLGCAKDLAITRKGEERFAEAE